MKTCKLLFVLFITGACAVCTHAQKLKYVPEAMKGAKAVPYVVKPKLPTTLRTGLAVPVVRPQAAPVARPNVATSAVSVAVERQVAAQITVEERLKRLESNLKKLEEYVRAHGNKLPYLRAKGEGSNLRKQVQEDIRSLLRNDLGVEKDRFFNVLLKRYYYLGEKHQQQVVMEYHQRLAEQPHIQQLLRAQEMEQGASTWRQVLLQDAAWKVQPEDLVPDPAENADKAAALGEQQIMFPGTVTTDEYVDQLLRFYNKMDPWGMGTIQ